MTSTRRPETMVTRLDFVVFVIFVIFVFLVLLVLLVLLILLVLVFLLATRIGTGIRRARGIDALVASHAESKDDEGVNERVVFNPSLGAMSCTALIILSITNIVRAFSWNPCSLATWVFRTNARVQAYSKKDAQSSYQ